MCERKEATRVLRWANENLLHLKTSEIGEHYGRYRLHVPEAERAMANRLSAMASYRQWSCADAMSVTSWSTDSNDWERRAA